MKQNFDIVQHINQATISYTCYGCLTGNLSIVWTAMA